MATSIVETVRINPFDFIITDAKAETIHCQYSELLKDHLMSYIRQNPILSELMAFAHKIAKVVRYSTMDFLTRLLHGIYNKFECTIREKGKPHSALSTLRKSKGACSDLTIFFMDCCCAMGLAARFVNGYQHTGKRR